jgi:four helix bundle protein
MSDEGMSGSGAKSERGLENLKIWQASLQFAVKVCKEAVIKLPPEEKYCLSNQLRRAAQSIPANIAEVYGRYYYQDNIRFCYIARRSLEETRSHLALAYKLGYLTVKEYKEYRTEIEGIRQTLNAYIGYLKRSKPGSTNQEQHIREQPGQYIAFSDETLEDILHHQSLIDLSPTEE